MDLAFRAVREDRPGAAWGALFDRLWPRYREWFLSQGDEERPRFLACERALKTHLPELLPTWERLVELAGGGDAQARFLSLWRPPPYIVGCSQAVLVGDEPLLVRNYDYDPRLCEGIVLRTEWNGRAVVASSDCLIGALDGINDAGLCVSLSFGGRRVVGEGFGAPLLVRFLLEFCETVAEASDVLRRVPTHMAYNVVVLDRDGTFVTAYTRPDGPTILRAVPVSTNHQGKVTWPRHAHATGSLEREHRLLDALADPDTTADALVASFLEPPLRSRRYDRGYGTLYTAVYRPRTLEAELLWPGERWALPIEAFEAGERRLSL